MSETSTTKKIVNSSAGKLKHVRTPSRITVDKEAAISSSLRELGSGIKPQGKMRTKFENLFKKKAKKK